jgi:hypothetical protein
MGALGSLAPICGKQACACCDRDHPRSGYRHRLFPVGDPAVRT